MNKYISILVFLFLTNIGFGQVSSIFRTTNSDFTIISKDIYKIISNNQSQTTTTQIGAPQLPVLTQSFALPQGSIVTNLSVSNGSKTEMGGG